jgi:DNA-directed RNA polymerase specialized sigma24 family protein
MDDSRFANVDFDNLLSRLYAVAQGVFARQGLKGDASILPGTGKSAEDLVLDVVAAFIVGEKVQWRPKQPDEDPFPLLVTALKHDFLDLVRKGRSYKRTVVVGSLQEEEDLGRIEHPDLVAEIEMKAQDAVTKKKVYALVKGEKELEDYVEVVLELGLTKPKEIAEFLEISSDQVRSRQRRVRTRLARWHRSLGTRNIGKGH